MSMELVKAEQSPEQQQITIPDVLPVLPMPDVVVFPYMIVPLFVNRERAAKAVDQALAENRMIMLVAQKDQGYDQLVDHMFEQELWLCAFRHPRR